MAYINVAEWSPDQVTDWLKGLDNSMYKYINSFTNNEIRGHALLNIRPYELNELGMYSIGHQEIVLEAIEQLRNFNYNLEKENLQFLALQVATTAKNLHKQLAYYFDKSTIETEILNDITRAISMIKPLVGWLDRSPFQGHLQFNEIRKRILRLGIEMATSAQRDRFVENPVDQIRLTAEKLSKLADYIIQDISDPIILQPSTLNLVTLKKRESELGFNIVPNYHGIHVITDIKYNSPAHVSGKIEDGDEIIQINYQTVVGWHYKRVLQQLQESPPDVLLTLKKRPKHTKIYGQIYMKPYRLPSKKRAIPYHLCENLPSPRIELMPSQHFSMLLPLAEKQNLSDSDSSSSCTLAPVKPINSNEKDLRLYLPKPRAVLQRRNTICGDQASGYRGNIIFWHEINNQVSQESPSLRDKSISFGFGLEISDRPTTCIGIHNVGNPYDKYGEIANALKGSLPDMKHVKSNKSPQKNSIENSINDKLECGNESNSVDADAQQKQSRNKMVKFSTEPDIVKETSLNGVDANAVSDKSVVNPLKAPAEMSPNVRTVLLPSLPEKKICADTELAEAVNVALINSQRQNLNDLARWDANSDSNTDKPPEIGPRKEYLKKKAPLPPPRLSKTTESLPRKPDSIKPDHVINESFKSTVISSSLEDQSNKSKLANVIDLKNAETSSMYMSIKANSSIITSSSENVKLDTITPSTNTSPHKKVPATKHFLEDHFEGLELLTPNKTKILTLKKKNSILAKRRKISLKTLDISDIQGHLFRRTKDKNGVTYWAKLYFVLVESALYGFRDKKSTKANCLIFLPGFTVSLAKEVHSKPFAYKVYHPKKSFYFAAESQQALEQWMDYIRKATLKGNKINLDPMSDINTKELYSETDSSDDDEDVFEEKCHTSTFFKHSVSNSKKRSTDDVPNVIKHEKYHLGFGSLKKFTKQSLPFSSNKNYKEREEKKKNASDIPVPTAQFRSYRKIPGNAGMQLGNSNSMTPIDYMINRPIVNVTVTVPATMPIPIIEPQKILIQEPVIKVTKPEYNFTPSQQTLNNNMRTFLSYSPESNPLNSTFTRFTVDRLGKPLSNLAKTKTLPYNYIHASNPNLVEFTFQTSKTLDYSLPKVNPSNFDGHHNVQGSITLKDLMLQREEAEAHNMYDNRVNLGVEKQTDRQQKRKKSLPQKEIMYQQQQHPHQLEVNENDPRNPNKPQLNKIQSRTLPKTPDYAQSFKTDDSEIIMARSKEGQKLRDFGYEFISGDDANSNMVMMANMNVRQALNAKVHERFALTSKRKGLPWTENRLKIVDDEKIVSKGSFKTIMAKAIDKTDKSLPKKPIHTGHQNEALDSNQSIYNQSINDQNESNLSNGERKTSIDRSASYFTKLSFPPSKTAKEKRLLGSPRLHRALFGRRNHEHQSIDHESFSPIDSNNKLVQREFTSPSISNATANQHDGNSNMPAIKNQPIEHNLYSAGGQTVEASTSIEYPPVFEAETYSLCDPSTSLTLMRRRTYNKKN